MDRTLPDVLAHKAHFLEMYREDLVTPRERIPLPDCPRMDPAQYKDPELRKCNHPRLGIIAIFVLAPEHHCRSDRPCPVCSYLLPH